MYGIHKELNKENVLEKVSSYSIFKKYCNNFKEVGKKFKSPLRDNDKVPSTYVIMYKGDLMLKDFGKGSYRAIAFVMEYYKLNYKEALEKINYDFNLGLGNIEYVFRNDHPVIEHHEGKINSKESSIIRVKRREFNNDDYEFWYVRYMINQHTLEQFNVYPIVNFTINDYLYFSAKLSYSYDYYWENGIFRRKIYQPLSDNKWYSNGGMVVQGEGMLPHHGDLLIVTSSLKDVMVLYEMGYTAIAPTSETSFVPNQYFEKQQGRFKKIVLFMDSDETGMKMNKRLSEKWGLDYISIPEEYYSKDISDLVYNHDKETAKKLIYEQTSKVY